MRSEAARHLGSIIFVLHSPMVFLLCCDRHDSGLEQLSTPCSSRDKAYVPGAKPKVDMAALDKELQELVSELQPTPGERKRQQVQLCAITYHLLQYTSSLRVCAGPAPTDCTALAGSCSTSSRRCWAMSVGFLHLLGSDHMQA